MVVHHSWTGSSFIIMDKGEQAGPIGVFLHRIVELVTFGVPAMVGSVPLVPAPVIDPLTPSCLVEALSYWLSLWSDGYHPRVSMSDAKNTARSISDGQKVPMTAMEAPRNHLWEGLPWPPQIIPATLAMASCHRLPCSWCDHLFVALYQPWLSCHIPA